MFDNSPLLAFFNLQGFYATLWDHPDLSKLLVALVEACDKRDFKNVIDCAIRCNKRRRDAFNNFQESAGYSNFESTTSSVAHGDFSMSSVELDIYKVLLYLAKYQCTTAFHTFFPATSKPCKGYHFWCAIGTPSPNFDRLFREAIRRTNNSGGSREQIANTIHDVSDVALAFRCVFGHLI
jgi:ankyrin repeat protein